VKAALFEAGWIGVLLGYGIVNGDVAEELIVPRAAYTAFARACV